MALAIAVLVLLQIAPAARHTFHLLAESSCEGGAKIEAAGEVRK
jgi:hypothetical protein